MALISCSECGRQLSARAAACPGCGHPSFIPDLDLPPRPRRDWRGTAAMAALVGLSVVGGGWTWMRMMGLSGECRGAAAPTVLMMPAIPEPPEPPMPPMPPMVHGRMFHLLHDDGTVRVEVISPAEPGDVETPRAPTVIVTTPEVYEAPAAP
jgi:hypothetical protein